MRDDLQQQIRHTLTDIAEATPPHDLPTSTEVWSRLRFRLAYRRRRGRDSSQTGTLFAALYLLAFLVWSTWSGPLSASFLAVLGAAAGTALYLSLRVSRIFPS